MLILLIVAIRKCGVYRRTMKSKILNVELLEFIKRRDDEQNLTICQQLARCCKKPVTAKEYLEAKKLEQAGGSYF
jgi:preprotein translocase subunit Sss1